MELPEVIWRWSAGYGIFAVIAVYFILKSTQDEHDSNMPRIALWGMIVLGFFLLLVYGASVFYKGWPKFF